MEAALPRDRCVTLRSVLLGALLIPVNVYWVLYTECVTGVAMATMASLLYTAVCSLLLAVLANRAIGCLRRRWMLRPGELLVAYAMTCVATAVAGHDQVEVLVTAIAYPLYHATPENQWATLFGPHLTRWLLFTDERLLTAFWQGHSSLSAAGAGPAAGGAFFGWLVFAVAFYGAMLSLGALFRPRWSDAERLAYPLVQLPQQIAARPRALFTGRGFWAGFTVAAAIDLLNGLHALYPAVPGLRVTATDLAPYLTTPLGRALGYMPVSLYPWIIGLGYLLPSEYLLSSTVFFWVWKAEVAYGALYARGGRFPYVAEQSAGAYLGVALFAVWMAWPHLRAAWQGVWDRSAAEDPAAPRWALPGLVAGFGGCLWGGLAVGMSWPVALVFFAVYLLVSLAVARVRAEMGVPAHDLLGCGPNRALTGLLGSAALGPKNLTGFAMMAWFNRAQRSHPMPHMVEGLELGTRFGERTEPMALAVSLGALLGFGWAFWLMVHLGCRHGWAGVPTDASYFGADGWRMLANQLSLPQPPDPGVLAAMAVGAGGTLVLLWLRTLFVWWPLHPIGYAVTSYFFGAILWLPLAVAWVVKTLVLRAGGLRLYHRLLPFFLGLILGEFVVGGAWSVVGVLTGWPTYRFWAY